MMSVVSSLFLAVALIATASAEQLHVLKHPNSVQVTATSVNTNDVSNLILGSLGASQFSKDTFHLLNPFKAPKQAVSLNILADGAIDFNSPKSMELSRDLEIPEFLKTLENQLQDTSSASFDDSVVKFVASNVDYFAQSAAHHVLAPSIANIEQLSSQLSSSPFSDHVSEDKKEFSFDGEKAITNSAVVRFISELLTVYENVKSQCSSATSTRCITSATISTFAQLPAQDRKFGMNALKFLVKVLKEELSEDALFTVLQLNENHHVPQEVSARFRRELDESIVSYDEVNQSDNMFSPSSPYFVEYCAEYKCYCTMDSKGVPFDPSTGCQKGCDITDKTCECVYQGCDCGSESVNPAMSVCKSCVDGYALHENFCYQDDDFPVAFNIIFWMALALILSLAVVSYSLGYMDPGVDSAMYRGTTHRMKTS